MAAGSRRPGDLVAPARGYLGAQAASAGVSFAAGEALFVTPKDQPYMRLNFSALDETEIERGIAKLADLL